MRLELIRHALAVKATFGVEWVLLCIPNREGGTVSSPFLLQAGLSGSAANSR
ncbi:hypothetical protein ACDZ29_04890 [Peribacillus sp. RS7]|uniref:hypothetical protein n=1 Tax=Peribacillus sp. RS7 TaxID=3242679 RepID=UPI0035BFBA76